MWASIIEWPMYYVGQEVNAWESIVARVTVIGEPMSTSMAAILILHNHKTS